MFSWWTLLVLINLLVTVESLVKCYSVNSSFVVLFQKHKIICFSSVYSKIIEWCMDV